MGVFGFTPATQKDKGGPVVPGQFLHRAKVDIDQALEESDELYGLFRRSQAQPTAPAFSGGVLDSWPAVAVDAFAVFKAEESAFRAWLKSEAPRG